MFGDIDSQREDERTATDDLGGHAGDDSTDDATRAVRTPPVTGDEAVDEAMMRLARSQAGSFAERIESGEHAHRSLQSRLGGPGGAGPAASTASPAPGGRLGPAARGLARPRTQARELATAGAVPVAGRPATKPALPVAESSTVELTREP